MIRRKPAIGYPFPLASSHIFKGNFESSGKIEKLKQSRLSLPLFLLVKFVLINTEILILALCYMKFFVFKAPFFPSQRPVGVHWYLCLEDKKLTISSLHSDGRHPY